MPWWQGTSTPWIGQLLNFLRFFQAKTAVPCGRRDVIVGEHRAYPQNNFRVGRNLHAKFGADGTVSEFSKIFSSKIRRPVQLP
jgi:hypothetical protein